MLVGPDGQMALILQHKQTKSVYVLLQYYFQLFLIYFNLFFSLMHLVLIQIIETQAHEERDSIHI